MVVLFLLSTHWWVGSVPRRSWGVGPLVGRAGSQGLWLQGLGSPESNACVLSVWVQVLGPLVDRAVFRDGCGLWRS